MSGSDAMAFMAPNAEISQDGALISIKQSS